MNNIARQEIYYGRYYSPKEVMKEIDSIKLSQIKDLAEGMLKREGFSITVYGAVYERDLKGIIG
jgi:predicted Zn-dependent peptidase